jgi:hypothetical protein
MQPILICLSVLALLFAPPARLTKINASGEQQRRSASSAARVKQPALDAVEAYGKRADVNAIEIYSKTLARYLKSHPLLMRFYVDAPPEGNADSSKVGKKDWYKVKNENQMLEAERGYATRSIVVAVKDREVVYARLGEPQEHSRHDNEYFFRTDGTLAKISSDYYGNIEEIHIARESFYDARGRLLRSTAHCFNIMTTSRGSKERPASCDKSEMREEFGKYILSVYAKNTDLPGYDILKGR